MAHRTLIGRTAALAGVVLITTPEAAAGVVTLGVGILVGYGISKGTGFDHGFANWWAPPVAVSENTNGTTNLTVNSNYTIVVLYGHGSMVDPHTFTVNGGQSFVGFIGCDSTRTNATIPASKRIRGLPIVTGDLKDWKDGNGTNQLDATIQAANTQAAAIAKQIRAQCHCCYNACDGNCLTWAFKCLTKTNGLVKP